eukprot:gene15728-biopygen2841
MDQIIGVTAGLGRHRIRSPRHRIRSPRHRVRSGKAAARRRPPPQRGGAAPAPQFTEGPNNTLDYSDYCARVNLFREIHPVLPRAAVPRRRRRLRVVVAAARGAARRGGARWCGAMRGLAAAQPRGNP